MRISVVTTLYMSEPYLRDFHTRIRTCAERITGDIEIIFVDDGSPDKSLQVALSLLSNDADVRVIELSRNFGHHKAIMTGLAHATGDLVFLIDSDLEEDPELLDVFYQQMMSTGADVVYGQQVTRRGDWWESLTGKAFYRAFALVSNTPIPQNLLTVRLMTSDYVRSLILHRERELCLSGIWQLTGYSQVAARVNKHSKGTSTYDLVRKIAILVNAVTSFSNKPLIFVFYLGCFILMLSSSAAGYLVLDRLFYRTLLYGWPSVIVSIWMMGGLILFCLGLIGIYMSKIFTEVKHRPYTIIKKLHTPHKI